MTIDDLLTSDFILDNTFNNSNSDISSRKKLLYAIALGSTFILSILLAVYKIFVIVIYANV